MGDLAAAPAVLAATIGATVHAVNNESSHGRDEPDPSCLDHFRTVLYVFGAVVSLFGCVYFIPGGQWQWIGDIAWIVGTAAFVTADSIELCTFRTDASTTWRAAADDKRELRAMRAQILLSLASNAAFVVSCVGFLPPYLPDGPAMWGGFGMISMWVGIFFIVVLLAWKLARYCSAKNSNASASNGSAAKPSDPLLPHGKRNAGGGSDSHRPTSLNSSIHVSVSNPQPIDSVV
jgi:hypothetical protein